MRPPPRQLLLAALLAGPLLWFAGTVWQNERRLAAAGEWRIPVSGADPRDLLRGRYIAFRYDWQVAGDLDRCTSADGCDLCLERQGDVIVAIAVASGATCPVRIDPRASRLAISGGAPDGPPRFTARLFVSEASAPRLEAELAAGPMVAVTRLTPEGRLVPLRLEPAER